MTLREYLTQRLPYTWGGCWFYAVLGIANLIAGGVNAGLCIAVFHWGNFWTANFNFGVGLCVLRIAWNIQRELEEG